MANLFTGLTGNYGGLEIGRLDSSLSFGFKPRGNCIFFGEMARRFALIHVIPLSTQVYKGNCIHVCKTGGYSGMDFCPIQGE